MPRRTGGQFVAGHGPLQPRAGLLRRFRRLPHGIRVRQLGDALQIHARGDSGRESRRRVDRGLLHEERHARIFVPDRERRFDLGVDGREGAAHALAEGSGRSHDFAGDGQLARGDLQPEERQVLPDRRSGAGVARHARNQGRGIPVRRSSGRVRRRRRREGRVPASHRGGTPRRGRIRLEERPDGALHRHPGLDHGHRHRSHGAHGHEDRTRGRLDHLLLSGNQLVGRHRRLELRHRRTESQNVRRQTRRTVLVRKQPILLVGLRRQLHHRTGQDV